MHHLSSTLLRQNAPPQSYSINLLVALQVRILNQKIAKYKRWKEADQQILLSDYANATSSVNYEVYKQRLTYMVDIFWLSFHLTELLDRWWDRFPEHKKKTFRTYKTKILETIHVIEGEMQDNLPRYPFDPHGYSLMHEIQYLFDTIRCKYEPFQFVLK